MVCLTKLLNGLFCARATRTAIIIKNYAPAAHQAREKKLAGIEHGMIDIKIHVNQTEFQGFNPSADFGKKPL